MANWSIANKRCRHFTNLGGQYLSEPGQQEAVDNYIIHHITIFINLLGTKIIFLIF